MDRSGSYRRASEYRRRTGGRNTAYTSSRQYSSARSDTRQRGYAPYVNGSAAPVYSYAQDEEQYYRKQQRAMQRARTQKKRAAQMNVAVLAFIFTLMCVMAASFVRYVSLQYQITNSVEEIADLQSELAALKQQNDEAYNKIISAVNLEDIKYTAIAELGMTYATNEQIITYSNDSDDYVHQLREVGK